MMFRHQLASRAKPAPPTPSAAGCVPGVYRSIGNMTRGETTLSFESGNSGMQPHTLSRWVGTRGATGPWIAVVAA